MPEDDELDEEPKNDGTVEPPRHIELEKLDSQSGGASGQSYSEGEAAPNVSDLQATLRRLFPSFPYRALDIVAQSIMVARIAPDMFLDSMRLTVNAVVQELDILGEEFDFMAVLNMVHAAYSIGLEGKGRVDVLEVAGAAKESEELDRLSKQMGIG